MSDKHRHSGGFIERESGPEDYRCTTQIRFFQSTLAPLGSSAYIVHPVAGVLQQVIKADRNTTKFDCWDVWVHDLNFLPMVLSGDTLAYVSNEPNIEGKTLEELGIVK